MTEEKNARALLEEALSAISFGDLDAFSDGENLAYSSDSVKTLEWEFGGWLKGAEYDADQEYDETMLGEEKPKVGVCSIGAIALASLDRYQLGKVIPRESYASFSTQAENPEVFKAAAFLAQAILERHGSRLWAADVDVVAGVQGVQKGFTIQDLMNAYNGEKVTKTIEYSYGNGYPIVTERSLDREAAIGMATSVITNFNDDDHTTWEEVIDVFKAAIKTAIEQEG